MIFFRGKYQRNEVNNSFLRAFSVSKSIDNNIFFIINGLTDGQKFTDKRFTDRVFSSVILLVN